MSVWRCILALLVLQISLAKCFSWDIVIVGEANRLQFYNNGTLTHTEDIPSAKEIYSITYDPVHYRVLFADRRYHRNHQISSFDLSTRNIQTLITRTSDYYFMFAYDPVTQLLFWRTEPYSIYSFSLNSASSNKSVDDNHILTLDHRCWDIAVESFGRYIYWITDNEIERARFDGSEREVLIDSTVFSRFSLAIDQHTQNNIYWIEKIYDNDDQISIISADLNGKNRRTLYTVKNETEAGSLTVSNDFIYWNSINQNAIWKLPKNRHLEPEPKLFSTSNNDDWYYQVIAANNTIKEF